MALRIISGRDSSSLTSFPCASLLGHPSFELVPHRFDIQRPVGVGSSQCWLVPEPNPVPSPSYLQMAIYCSVPIRAWHSFPPIPLCNKLSPPKKKKKDHKLSTQSSVSSLTWDFSIPTVSSALNLDLVVSKNRDEVSGSSRK